MNRVLVTSIVVATVLFVGLLIALSIFRSNIQSYEQASISDVIIPTSSPNNQTTVPAKTLLSENIPTTTNIVNSNDDRQLVSEDRAAIENVVKKLPIDSDSLKIEYSELLDTFYIQDNATNKSRVRKFIEENNLSNLYKARPEFFKFTNQNPEDVLDEDEEAYSMENGLGEEITKKDVPITGDKKLTTVKNFLNSLTSVNFLTSSSEVTVTPQSAGLTPTGVTVGTSTLGGAAAIGNKGSSNTRGCENIIGNERIICAALKFTGIRYGFVNNQDESIKRWGVKSQGTYGRPPAEWIATRTPEGPTDFLVCSSYTDLAIYVAFGFYKLHLSHSYLNDKENFREVPVNSTIPGDLVIKGTAVGGVGEGHVAILVTRYANGSMKTLESTSAKSGRSGYFSRKPGSFTRAVRYIGPGSTP